MKHLLLFRTSSNGRRFRYSPDCKLLATSGDDRSVKLWDLTTGKELAIIGVHADVVNEVVFIPQPDGASHHLVTASQEGAIKVWEVSTGQLVTELNGHKGAVRSLDVSRDGQLLATAGDDETVRLWDAQNGQLLTELHGHTRAVAKVQFSPNGVKLATVSEDGTARIWDVSTRELLFVIDTPARQPVDTVAFTPDGQSIGFPGSTFGRVYWWDVKSGRRSKRKSPQYRYDSRLSLISFDQQGRICLTGGMNCELVLRNATDFEPLARFGSRQPTSGVISPDGPTFAIGSAEGKRRCI